MNQSVTTSKKNDFSGKAVESHVNKINLPLVDVLITDTDASLATCRTMNNMNKVDPTTFSIAN